MLRFSCYLLAILMVERIDVNPKLIEWAIGRSGLATEALAADRRFRKLHDWLSGDRTPTHNQLEQFAKKTMTPLGYFFLDEPPVEKLPIPDFRTMGDTPITRPSPNLIDTIQTMQRRQDWMREYLIEEGHESRSFVGSSKGERNSEALASRIRETLELSDEWASGYKTWEHALRRLRASIEQIGILVATASVVGLNNHRPLDPEEFRGFVLCDEYAPLIFVNGADSKSAQMFTLAHELVHVWLGRGGIFNLIQTMPSDDKIERFCNQTAAEFLLPGRQLQVFWNQIKSVENPFKNIAARFKVSPLAAARRALDLGLINEPRFFAFYEQDQRDYQARKESAKKKPGGPSFYDVQDARLGKRFAAAVVSAVREGRILHRDAYQLTDLRRETFTEYSERLTRRLLDERKESIHP